MALLGEGIPAVIFLMVSDCGRGKKLGEFPSTEGSKVQLGVILETWQGVPRGILDSAGCRRNVSLLRVQSGVLGTGVVVVTSHARKIQGA